MLNRVSPTADKCTLERAVAGSGDEEYKGWAWETVGEVDYTVSGNILQVSIPRAMLDMEQSVPAFNFKWSDNMQVDGDILDFYQYGEAAPGGRFTFVFDPSSDGMDVTPVPSAAATPNPTPSQDADRVTNPETGDSAIYAWVILIAAVSAVRLTGLDGSKSATVDFIFNKCNKYWFRGACFAIDEIRPFYRTKMGRRADTNI